jgi:predicted DNA repair protein MutK
MIKHQHHKDQRHRNINITETRRDITAMIQTRNIADPELIEISETEITDYSQQNRSMTSVHISHMSFIAERVTERDQ